MVIEGHRVLLDHRVIEESLVCQVPLEEQDYKAHLVLEVKLEPEESQAPKVEQVTKDLLEDQVVLDQQVHQVRKAHKEIEVQQEKGVLKVNIVSF